MTFRWRGIASAYSERLPHLPKDKEKLADCLTGVNCSIGGTPLIYSRSLSAQFYSRVFLKLEYTNPVLSHYYRGLGICVPVAQAQLQKRYPESNTATRKTVVLARAEHPLAEVLRAVGLVAARNACSIAVVVADPNLQVDAANADSANEIELAAGLASLTYVKASYTQTLRALQLIAQDAPVAIVGLDTPEFFDAAKTLAFEIVDLLGDAPHVQVVSADYPGQLAAHWLGYREYAGEVSELSVRTDAHHQIPQASRLPQLLAASRAGQYYGYDALAATESRAQAVAVSADALAGAHTYLQQTEGLNCGDNAAAVIAALQVHATGGALPYGIDIVCTLVDAMPFASRINIPDPRYLCGGAGSSLASTLAAALQL